MNPHYLPSPTTLGLIILLGACVLYVVIAGALRLSLYLDEAAIQSDDMSAFNVCANDYENAV